MLSVKIKISFARKEDAADRDLRSITGVSNFSRCHWAHLAMLEREIIFISV